MEAEERRSGGAGKVSKKGGKRVKALSAAEEARRREVVKEKLREKLELENRALKIVERLLEDCVAEDFLVDCAKFITPANYKDTVEERSIAKLCGYPICSNKLGKVPTQQYKICTKTNKVYDITERKCFCSNFCYKASKEFELQISTTPLWLRQHESPPEVKLMKRGDGGSSGEEVLLTERRLEEKDIENPLPSQLADARTSQDAAAGHSDSSDIEQEQEQEQDFVSSVVSQRQGPRVHWGDLPKRTDEDNKGERGKTEKQMKHRREGGADTHVETDSEKQLHSSNTDQPNGEQVPEERGLLHEPGVEEATEKLNLCSLSEGITHTAPPPVGSTATQAEDTTLPTSSAREDSNSSTESKPVPSSTLITTNQDSLLDFHITQVGMSKRGAAGLRDLLKNHTAGARPDNIRVNLVECLRRTLSEWSTEETLKFLYGAEHSLGLPSAHGKEEKEVVEEEEELDEDDLEDEVTDEDAEGGEAGAKKRPSAAAPDYQTLRQETQQLELRVKEFYKGTLVLPEEAEELHENKVTVQDQSTKGPALPLVDSHAQHLIQKRITVERLTSCLRNIVGPLCLTMSDISTDLNSLVRTFRFTNKNIIHKTPEWTLLAVVLLHLLSAVSPVVQEALETAASVEYLNTLMEELGLQEQDLLNLVRLFKTPAH